MGLLSETDSVGVTAKVKWCEVSTTQPTLVLSFRNSKEMRPTESWNLGRRILGQDRLGLERRQFIGV